MIGVIKIITKKNQLKRCKDCDKCCRKYRCIGSTVLNVSTTITKRLLERRVKIG